MEEEPIHKDHISGALVLVPKATQVLFIAKAMFHLSIARVAASLIVL